MTLSLQFHNDITIRKSECLTVKYSFLDFPVSRVGVVNDEIIDPIGEVGGSVLCSVARD